MIPTSATSPATTPSPTFAMLGIASLILEGRALSDDEFVISTTHSGDKLPTARVSNSGSHYSTTPNSASNSFTSQAMEPDPTLQHFQRLRQKLGQLRQSSPGTSRDNLAEQEITVGQNASALAAARSADDSDEGDVNPVIQRTLKPGRQVADGTFLYTLQSLASTCLRTTPRSFNTRSRDMILPDLWINTNVHPHPMKAFATPSCSISAISNISASSSSGSSSNSHPAIYVNPRIVKVQQPNRGEKVASPKQGPHCDQFLKKLGLGKGEVSEAEEHFCDMANLNEICYRWHIHCRQIEVIMSRCDPICIEVYLGPESHQLLLEQWIIQQRDKSDTPNMTLQSLCNAIRSQLYFSQITAWSDLLRKSSVFDKEIQESGRVKVSQMQKKPRLDIFYRIKSYDSTACFNAKPNVHNFPSIALSEHCTVSVCLKSLPRLQGGIPKIGDFLGMHPASTSSSTNSMVNESNEQQGASREEAMVLDDRMTLPCQEKGKHKCVFDEEDGSSDTVGEGTCSSGLSHREKQLLKYKKRMLKRDRKTKKAVESPKAGHCQLTTQLKEKRPAEDSNHCPDLVNSQQAMHEFSSINSINSIRPPLYQTTTIVTEAVQTNTVEMISIGTQTADFPMSYPSCRTCGHDMQLVCWNCEQNPHQASPNHLEANEPPKLGKGDLLLQAIQRTPQRKNQDMRNNNNSPDPRGFLNANVSNCQLCKRQKTGHHYNASENGVLNGSNSPVLSSPNVDLNKSKSSQQSQPQCSSFSNGCHTNAKMSPSFGCGCSKSSVLHFAANCDLDIEEPDSVPNGKHVPSLLRPMETSLPNEITAQFKTPKVNITPKNHLKPSALPISHSEKFMKSLPKVNLSNIFCGQSSPIPITSPDSFSFDEEAPEIPVQKSNSAPTLPNSPSLSPRFLKQAAIYKRRSRHLSDRSSERSSFGSDEQFSDEDLDSVYSPVSSPIKNRAFLRCSSFGRKPLLGNLEESLLQKRFVPKTQVAGFKVLLGASGAYCPTQLTIPAAAYFFELSGQTLSTPYMCEIRLSRKGYTIPRTGTVQATLLNPLGTVVRMFVIPYDFRDMPPMSQTFIRQRILAIDPDAEEKSDNSKESTSSSGFLQSDGPLGNHMHSLRYSIHLRFQTSRSGRLSLHTDIRFLISRRTDCDTAAAHAKGALESPNDLRVITITPEHPKYSPRQENPNKI